MHNIANGGAELLDAAGVLAGFSRMPGSFLASVDYAQWKAWTAASFAMSTADFAVLLEGMPDNVSTGLLKHPQVTSLSGGLPIRVEEHVIGAIGVSGGNDEQDCAVARVALRAIESLED